ncbi:flagellar basal-body MS-ring/collar protein FliF [Xenophilus arseniciresistens]|uniref:Flagellar M-ring protein n=1 Tax=Xenophilus arseniciresistens TaxID=1283306 RepID=A0AAE3N5H9_9BURK|nr:flagellar basal-body MS-ring/collar protein FliF [Xenophilus arseniciresistens]MDA7415233.1 flagellar basal-body MS-ring/collar protein FliF [Xenophilus arseniciresistens]
MSAAAALPAAVPPANGPLALPARLQALSPGQRMRLAAGVALLVAIAIAAVVIGRTPDWRVLYANLADKDGGAIVAQLAQMNVPYKYSEGGGAVMVPADKVHDLRLRLAAQGLPKGSVVGYELTDSNRFGMTQFQEKLSFQRALEGELTRSIQALGSVQSARVHLALPTQNGFFREQQKPSASVLLSLYPGRALERAQVAGIVHLVASSVPELNPAAVSVVDDSGKLLSGNGEGAGAAGGGGGVDAQQLAYTQQIEQQLTRRIMDILEPIVGRQNVKAQVTADVDFSKTEATSEEHKPNLAANASAVRSQQTVESTGPGAGGAAAAGGVPGATTNQPPTPPAAPINGAAAPLAPTGAAAAATAAAAPSRRESVTNYEVDKTIRTVRGATGQVRRLSAAVVVNYQGIVNADGKSTPTALPPEQLEKMTALVRESIGFSSERGDSVNLMNAPFLGEAAAAPVLPWWKRPEMLDLVRSLAWPVSLGLLGVLVLFGLVRPGLKLAAAHKPAEAVPALPAPPGAQLSALIADETPRPALGTSEAGRLSAPAEVPEQARLEGARQMARQNPVAVANIVKTWINGDAARA